MTNTPRRCGWRWKRLPSCSSGPRGSAGDTHTLRHFPHHLPRTTNHANIGTATTPLEVLMANIINLTPHPVTLVTANGDRSEEHTSELQSRENCVCRLLLETKTQQSILTRQ